MSKPGKTGIARVIDAFGYSMKGLAELANSSVEAVVDRTGSERHELSGRAKDIGSALVFTSLVLLALVWGIVATHRFGNFL